MGITFFEMPAIQENSSFGGGDRKGRTGQIMSAIARHERRIKSLEGVSRRISWIRLGIVLAGIATALLLFHLSGEVAGWTSIAITVAVFMLVADRHGRIEQGIRRGKAWVDIRRRHLARLGHQWSLIPIDEVDTADATHPFERDLNITGERSLLHLIDTSVSAGGRLRLKTWLLACPPDIAAVKERQALVAELIDLPLARDRIALAARLSGAGIGGRWREDILMQWLNETEGGRLTNVLLLLFLLAGLNLTAIVLGAAGSVQAMWPATLVLYGAVYLHRRRDFSGLFQEALYLSGALGRAEAVLKELERFPVSGRPALRRLLAPFRNRERRPSSYLKSVTRIANAAAMQKNGIVRLMLNLLVPWDYYFAWKLRRAREEIRELLPIWLDRLYELEALSSLANYAWLDPQATFAEIRSSETSDAYFDAQGMHHPLIPRDRSVPNNFMIRGSGTISIITGSNMSGKSTFLRTIGATLALAYAGGAVRAERLTIAPFRLFTCISVSDSVNDGISYFYAEVERLKRLLAEIRRPDGYMVFYLIDEIFRGTNNRERLVGARSFIRALAQERGVGAISTHDLELVQIADEIDRVENYHFREEIMSGKMKFDYRIRRGPSPTTNALIIMKMEGLPVDTVEDFGTRKTQ